MAHADVAKLADALDLGSSALRHGGSSPFIRTILIQRPWDRTHGFFMFVEINLVKIYKFYEIF
jgi:hypothetical protein